MSTPDHEKLRQELEDAAAEARQENDTRRSRTGRNVLVGILAAIPVATAAILAVNAFSDEETDSITRTVPDPDGPPGGGTPENPVPTSAQAAPSPTPPSAPPSTSAAPVPGATGGQGGGGGTGAPSAHHVAEGDTLAEIAQKYGVSTEQLAEANGISNPNRIAEGAELSIPAAEPGTTVIKAGATLSALAREHGTTVERLMELNPQIRDADRITAGGRLRLP